MPVEAPYPRKEPESWLKHLYEVFMPIVIMSTSYSVTTDILIDIDI